jgi:hypothetical protein
MAIFRPSPLIGDISGALGATIFYTGGRAGTIGTRPQFTPPITYESQKRQLGLHQYQTAWRAQTDAYQASWRTFAQSFPWTNRLNIRRPLSGYSAFLSYHLQFQPYGAYTLTVYDPPQSISSPVLTITAVSFSAVADCDITVAALPPADTREYLIIRRYLQYGPRTSAGMTRLAGILTRNNLTLDYETSLNLQKIYLEVGELIGLTLYWISPGLWPSIRVDTQTTVT